MKKRKLFEADIDWLQSSREEDVHISPAVAAAAKQIARMYESEPGARDGWMSDQLGWRELREACYARPELLREANPSSAFGQLLRTGVQVQANDFYRRYPSVYEQVAKMVTSTGRQEFAAPAFGSAFPREVGEGSPFQESGFKTLDLEFINRSFGGMESFPRQLFDDDQTGQVRDRSQTLGEAMRQWEGAYTAVRFTGLASTAYPQPITASDTTYTNFNGDTITGPFSTTFYATAYKGGDATAVGRGNKLGTFKQLNLNSFLDVLQLLRRAVDPLGVPMVINVNTLYHSAFDEIEAKHLLQSPTFPALPGRGSDTTVSAAVPGFMRGGFSNNPVQGMVKPVMDIYLPLGAWYMGEANKGFRFQRRTPMEVIMEAAASGADFELAVKRFRSFARFVAGWEWGGYWGEGNDGSASLSH